MKYLYNMYGGIMSMKEIWKRCIKGQYEVSNLGNVYSVRRRRLLKPQNCNGYLQVGTQVDKHRKRYMVHQLVARKFIGHCPEGKEVNHKDLNRQNNRVANLEYVTKKRNIRHARDNHFVGVQKLTWKEIKQIRRMCEDNPKGLCRADSTYLTQTEIGRKFGVSAVLVSYIASKKIWQK